MRVNIIVGSADQGWIIGRMARELVTRLPRYDVTATINGKQADLEHHPVVYGEPNSRPATGMFTHGSFRPHKFAKSYDGHIGLCSSMKQYLIEGGAQNPVVIESVVDERFILKRPLCFGVAGRTYSDGRKGEHLVKAMVEAGYNVIAWGSGWPCKILSSNLADLEMFYRSIDYYVDTSSDEGGCVPAIEAMAMGVPVISHTVGVDRPVIAYERHDWKSLKRVLQRLTTPRTYNDWAYEHAQYFKAVLQQNWTEFWEGQTA